MTVEFIEDLFKRTLTAVEVEQVGDSNRFDVRLMPESHPTGAYLYSEVYLGGVRVNLNEHGGYSRFEILQDMHPENIDRVVFVHEPSGAHYWEVYFTDEEHKHTNIEQKTILP